MTSTRSPRNLLVLITVAAIAFGATGVVRCHGRKKNLVQLDIVDAKKRYWTVTISDKQVIAKSYDREDLAPSGGNFEERDDWIKVDGQYLAYDLESKKKEVLPRSRESKSTQWEKLGSRFGMRLRMRNGELKGWWVGLKVVKEKAERGKPALAHLVLVKHTKDAAVFRWGDPYDEGP